MNWYLGIVAALILSFAVMKGFSTLWKKRRSGPENNWKNEAYVAREEEGSWVENDHSVASSDSAARSYFP
jgi:hypothetical protein